MRNPNNPVLRMHARSVGFWARDYWHAVWDGTRWLPMRYTSESEALDWYLDVKEANWNKTTALYKWDGNRWSRKG